MPKIEELEPLLTAPIEALNVEYKTWLDLKGNDEHKANFAKAAIAIANEGDGHIVIGMREERPKLISETRPAHIAAYDQDMVNRSFGASPEGRMFLLRGYVEDSDQTLAGLPRLDGGTIEPSKAFDLENMTWSISECFLHAANVASLLAPGRDVRVHLQARWYGLAGRRLASIWGTRLLTGDYICRQDEYATETTVDVLRIEDNLPEIVDPLIAPLYERFSFFQLPSTLVAKELATMKSRRF